MSTDSLLDEARKLSVSDRMLLLEEIWDSIGMDQSVPPLTPEQREELDQRLADYQADPQSGTAWPEVRAQIERKS
jgi:putative addiction module component (TIGR02574 family)